MTDPCLPQKEGVPTIRRLVMAITALGIIAAILVAASPVDAGVRRVALGVWIPDGNRTPAVYKQFGNEVGRQPAVVNMSVQWGDPDLKWFPRAQADAVHANGSRVMITWTPTINPIAKETGKYARFRNIVKGKHDKYIKKFARQIKSYGKPVWLRPFHEINASFFPWTKGWGKFYNPKTGVRDIKNDNNPKKYKKAWQRVYNLFQKVGAKNAKFLWTVAKESCKGCNPYKVWRPKTQQQYFMAGFSTFNWGGFNGRPFASFVQGMKQPMKNFKQFNSKPIIVAELGTTHLTSPSGETKSDWLTAGYPAVRSRYPKVKAVIYQHVSNHGAAHGHPSWDLDDPKGSINAYKNLLKNKKFQGRVNKKGQVR